MFVANKVVTNMFVVVPVSVRGLGRARAQPLGFQPSAPARYFCGV
jgi:predicted secreted protein